MHKFYDINLRITKDDRFWGTKFAESVYFSQSSVHSVSLCRLNESNISFLSDPFRTPESVQHHHGICKQLHSHYCGILAHRLNTIHKSSFPAAFWRDVFGNWLYRHISITYDKFLRLQQLDANRVSLKVCSREHYYTPSDHYDYVRYFCTDYGVVQLVSEYFSAFCDHILPAVDVSGEVLASEFAGNNSQCNVVYSDDNINELKREAISKADGTNNDVGICCAYYPNEVFVLLSIHSNGGVRKFKIPKVSVSRNIIDAVSRSALTDSDSTNPFERYLFKTLYASTPKFLIEYFYSYVSAFTAYIHANSFMAIVTECWTSFMPVSMFCALSRYLCGTKLIFQQHGASVQMLDSNILWLEQDSADIYLTTGWKGDTENSVSGGFAIRQRLPYVFREENCDILHISTSRLPYLISVGAVTPGGSRFIEYLREISAIYDLLPTDLKSNYVFRPRREKHYWDTERSLDLQMRNIRVMATGDLLPLMLHAKIVIIDHISTALAEIMNNNIPFVLFYVEKFEPLSERYTHIFDELEACGVVHRSAVSLTMHIANVYDDVQGWWQSTDVQNALASVVGQTLLPADVTMKYFLSLLDDAR